MFPILFAVRTAWLVVLLALIAVSILWFMFRAIGDFVEWFKDEIIDDFRDRRKKRKGRQGE